MSITEATGAIQFAAVSVAGSGDNTLVAAVTARKIRVLSGMFYPAAAVNIRFESGAGTSQLSGLIILDPAGVTGPRKLELPWNPGGHFETVAAQLLNLELSGAIQVSGWISYQEVR